MKKVHENFFYKKVAQNKMMYAVLFKYYVKKKTLCGRFSY